MKKQKKPYGEEALAAPASTAATSKKRKNRSLDQKDDYNPRPKGDKDSGKKKKDKSQSHQQENENNGDAPKKNGGDEAEDFGRRKRITDPRFASVHADPRFQRMHRRHAKVSIDSRFAGAFKDARFALSTAPVDKRGRARKEKRQNPLLHYYVQEDEEPGVASVEGDGEALIGREDALPSDPALLKLDVEDTEELGSDSTSTTSSSSSSSSDEDEEDDDDDQCSVSSDIAHYLMGNHGDAPEIEEATRRLAVVNLDWDHVKAVDIYVVMRSCLPKDGCISSVMVYPSEFGIKCMEVEATRGPSALINGNQGQDDSDMEDSDSQVDEEIENEKLRSYELNKLRYYYAVVDCDTSITANHLYESLNGAEFLKTSNIFDLRFVPDSMDFPHPPRDIATEAPASYKEPDFHTRALQHSNVKLSWEEDEPKRKKILRRKFNADKLDDLGFKEFLASDHEDSDVDEDDENMHDKKTKEGEKYRALLQSAEGSGAEDGSDQDMEITFNTGLEDIAKRVLEKKDHKSDTVWEAYLRRRKEKKKTRKKNSKYSSDEDDSSDSYHSQQLECLDQRDDFFEEDDSDIDVDVVKSNKCIDNIKSKKSKKSKGDKKLKKLDKDQEASQAELELLCANIERPEQSSKDDDSRPKKVKKGKKKPSETKLPKENCYDDPRFSALFTSHLYALDPTDPQFKRSATYARQIIKQQKDGILNPPEHTILEPDPSSAERTMHKIDQPNDNWSSKEQAEFFSLVRSLKQRTDALGKGMEGK